MAWAIQRFEHCWWSDNGEQISCPDATVYPESAKLFDTPEEARRFRNKVQPAGSWWTVERLDATAIYEDQLNRLYRYGWWRSS